MDVQKAKEVLKKAGYVLALWNIVDVLDHEDINRNLTKEEAHDIILSALDNEATMEQIWFAIKFHAEQPQEKRQNLWEKQ